MKEIRAMMENFLNLKRAPSQNKIFFYLLGTGKTMAVREIAKEVEITPKATERAIAKLLTKGLIQRSPFRDGSYACDNRHILLGLLLIILELHEKLNKSKSIISS